MKRTTKFYRKNEEEVMKSLGLKPTKNSGSGWIEKEENLSHEGYCWVRDNAKVYGTATVGGSAIVRDDATVGDSATVRDSAIVCDDALVCDDATVGGTTIVGDGVK